MKPNRNRLILRYPKEYFDKMLNSGNLIQIVNQTNDVSYIPEIAIVEESYNSDFRNGDHVVVQYLVALDKTIFVREDEKRTSMARDIYQEDKRIYLKYQELKNQMKLNTARRLIQDWAKKKYELEQAIPDHQPMKVIRNQFFLSKEENGDEIRWCNEDQIFGFKRDEKISPIRGFVFCELPPERPTMIGSFYLPDTFRKADTEKKGYKTKIKYIHDSDSENLNLNEGDVVWCGTNTDAQKKIWDEVVIRVRAQDILAKEN